MPLETAALTSTGGGVKIGQIIALKNRLGEGFEESGEVYLGTGYYTTDYDPILTPNTVKGLPTDIPTSRNIFQGFATNTAQGILVGGDETSPRIVYIPSISNFSNPQIREVPAEVTKKLIDVAYLGGLSNDRTYVAIGTDGVIVASFDNGFTFSKLNFAGLETMVLKAISATSVTVNESRRCFIAGDSGLVLRGTGSLSTWEVMTLPSTAANYNFNAIEVDTSGLIVVAVGDNGAIVRSSDAGVTWVDLTDPNNTDDFIKVRGYTTNWIVGSRQCTLLISNNSGAAWYKKLLGVTSEIIAIGMQNTTQWVVYFSKPVLSTFHAYITNVNGDVVSYNHSIVTTPADATSLRVLSTRISSTDAAIESTEKTFRYTSSLSSSGANIQSARTDSLYLNDVVAMESSGNGTILAFFSDNSYLRSADDGSTWTRLNALLPLNNTPIKHLTTNKLGVWYLITIDNKIYRSVDDGITWALFSHTSVGSTINDICCLDDIIIITGNSNIIRSTNAGVTWGTVSGLPGQTFAVRIASDGVTIAISYNNGTGNYTLNKNINYGASGWTIMVASGLRETSKPFTNNRGVWAVVSGNPNETFLSNNNGGLWTGAVGGLVYNPANVIFHGNRIYFGFKEQNVDNYVQTTPLVLLRQFVFLSSGVLLGYDGDKFVIETPVVEYKETTVALSNTPGVPYLRVK